MTIKKGNVYPIHNGLRGSASGSHQAHVVDIYPRGRGKTVQYRIGEKGALQTMPLTAFTARHERVSPATFS